MEVNNATATETAGSRPRAFTRDAAPHLSDLEWSALERMSEGIGPQAVASMLHTLSHDAQHVSIAHFIQHELDGVRRQVSDLMESNARQAAESRQQIDALMGQARQQTQLLASQQRAANTAMGSGRRVETLKVEVSKYRAAEGESLLRWLVELDDAVSARRLEDDATCVTFAVSNLAGRAKAWALGLKLRDPRCFTSYEDFKSQLKQTFEPPKSEFRARTEFLDLKQGKRDVHAYAQQARYLVSCIVTEPIDDQTQVVTYIKGLLDGPIKTHLFREYPATLEEAIRLSLQEDFSLRQAYVHSASYRPPRREEGGPEPMDLSVADGATHHPNKRTQTCNRCKKIGHFAYECLAPRPASRSAGTHERRDDRPSQGARPRAAGGRGRPKNGRRQ
jgi:hypothetical protein